MEGRGRPAFQEQDSSLEGFSFSISANRPELFAVSIIHFMAAIPEGLPWEIYQQTVAMTSAA